jgi:glycine betaine/proline transport system substrate-binding protein
MMIKNIRNLVSGVAVALMATAGAAQAANDPDVTIGWTAWSDAEYVTKMAAIILGEMKGYDVELTLSDIPVQYRGVANGDLDAMLMSWQPATHASYLEKYGDQLVDLGPLYEDAQLGWAVPAYIPEDQLSSIEDLKNPEVRAKLNGTIQGIDPDAGLSAMSRRVIEDYGLDYEISYGSGPLMAKNLGEAIQNEEWIVVTAWNPHWIFGKYELRYLEEEQGIMEPKEHVNALVRKGFKQDQPEIAAFFERMQLEMGELEALMARGQDVGVRQAVVEYIKNNMDKVRYWVTGER